MEPRLSLPTLRQELKEWQRAFGFLHNGRKPTREDIKADETIARKYSAYAQLADALAGRVDTSRNTGSHKHRLEEMKSKRKRHGDIANASPKRRRLGISYDGVPPDPVTPSKRGPLYKKRQDQDCSVQTPRRDASLDARPDDLDPNSDDTPRSEKAYIDPTPQRNGRLMGIFDVPEDVSDVENLPPLSWTKVELGTAKSVQPRNSTKRVDKEALTEGEWNVQSQDGPDLCIDPTMSSPPDPLEGNYTTPTKIRQSSCDAMATLPDATPTDPFRHGKTPPSSGRKFALAYALDGAETSKIEDSIADPVLTPRLKPTSASPAKNVDKTGLGTPSFLRISGQTRQLAPWQTRNLECIPERGALPSVTDVTPSKHRRRTSHTIASQQVLSGKAWRKPKPLRKFSQSFRELISGINQREEDRLDEEQHLMDAATAGDATTVDGKGINVTSQEESGTHSWPRKKKGPKRQTKKIHLKPRPLPVALNHDGAGRNHVRTALQDESTRGRNKSGSHLHQRKVPGMGWEQSEVECNTESNDESSFMPMPNKNAVKTQRGRDSCLKRTTQPLNLVRMKHLSRVKGKKSDRTWRRRVRKMSPQSTQQSMPSSRQPKEECGSERMTVGRDVVEDESRGDLATEQSVTTN